VIGLVSIFNYGFRAAKTAFERAGVPYVSLSNYPTLIGLALEKGLVGPRRSVLLKWSEDPENWRGEDVDLIAYFYRA